jgi:methylated-DNA-[protein]-cysteine S-methyltransferase
MKQTRLLHYTHFRTPLGTFAAAVDADGAVAGAAFGGPQALRERLPGATLVHDERKASTVRAEIEAWFRGDRRDFSFALCPAGTPFQRRVWDALQKIPFGRTLSYGEVARSVRSSARAVGRANATNPICVIVPCHRVIGADGSLTGYAFGEATKRRLLEFEAA